MRQISVLLLAASFALTACEAATGEVAGATAVVPACTGVETDRCQEVAAAAASELVPGAVVRGIVVERIVPGDGLPCATDGCTPVADVTFELLGGTSVVVRVVSVEGELHTETP